jgi:membrane complex biogenesis BtpA family protein
LSPRAQVIGVIHLAPLPGSPRWKDSIVEIRRAAAEDARLLAEAGFDGAIVENFGDAPFLNGRVEAVTVSAITACALAIREATPRLSLGINVLRNDAEAAMSVACVVGATFVRVNVHTSARVTDQGLIQGDAAGTLRLRRMLRGEQVQVWADADVKHSAPLAPRRIADEARDLVGRGLADVVLVTGAGTGCPVEAEQLDVVKRAVKVPVLVASGVTIGTLSEYSGRCDGVIVGSALRGDGTAGGPVDGSRARDFVRAFREAFAARA